jgi:hypothetical protein
MFRTKDDPSEANNINGDSRKEESNSINHRKEDDIWSQLTEDKLIDDVIKSNLYTAHKKTIVFDYLCYHYDLSNHPEGSSLIERALNHYGLSLPATGNVKVGRMGRDLSVGVMGALVSAAILGVLAWGTGVQLGLRELDDRTRDQGLTLQQVAGVLQENARQTVAQGDHIERLNSSVEQLVVSSREERQANRESFKELQALTRDNAIAIRDLLNIRGGEGRPPR